MTPRTFGLTTGLACFGAVMLATCAFAPDGAGPFIPPPGYRAQWDSAQACTGKTGDYAKLTFFLVPGHDFKCESGRCIGEWQAPFLISIAEDWKNINWVVRHEMIHVLVGKHFPGDTVIWGQACRATWGWLGDDPNYRP